MDMKQTKHHASHARGRRLLAVILSFVMVLSLLPSSLFITAAAQDAEIPTNVNTGRIVYVNGDATGNGSGSTPENAFTTLEAAFAALSAGSGDAVIVVCGTVNVAQSYNNLKPENGKVTWDGVYYITGDYGTDYSDSALIRFTNTSAAHINMGGKTHFSNLNMQLDAGGVTFYTAGGMTIGEGVECKINSSNTFSIYGGCWEGDYEGDVSIKVSSGKIGTIMGGTKSYTVNGTVDITIGGNADITGNITSVYKKTTGNVNLTVNGGKINAIYAVGRANSVLGGDLTINLNAGEITQVVDHSGTGQKAKSVTVNLKPACQIGTFTALSSGRVTVTNGTVLNLSGYNGTLPVGILDCFNSANIKAGSNVTYTSTLGASTSVLVESGSTLRLAGNENGTGLNVTGEGVKYGMPVASLLYVNGKKVYGDSEAPNGSKGAPYTSLADAYACIDEEDGGTIVIMGDTAWDGDYSGYGITGTVNITSSYDGDSYIIGDTPAYLVLTGDVTLSDSTIIDNVKVNVNKDKMFLYTGMELTVGSNVAMTQGVKNAALKVVCAKDGSTATKGKTINVSIAGGEYHTIFMGNVNTVDTGSVNLTLSGDVKVTSNVQVSPNKGSAEALHFTMDGNSDVNSIYNSGGTNGAVAGDITIDLKSGTIGSMSQVGNKTPTIGNITVNLYDGFEYGSGSFGTWKNVTTGTRTLNLIGFNDVLNTGAAANYNVLYVKNVSNVTYAGTLASGSTVTVETGSVLTLTGYTDQTAAEGAGLTVNGNKAGYGTVLFGNQTITYPEKVYVNTEAYITERDGLTPETGVATLQEAIQLLDPNEGGIIVLCSELVMSSDVNLEGYNIGGQVTLTSVDGTTDYRQAGARLTWQGDKRSLITSGNMFITGLNFHLNSGANQSQFIYSGKYLKISDTVANTADSSGILKIFVSKHASAREDNCVAYVYGGTYNQIYVGSNATVTGDSTLFFGGNAFVTSNVACGPNSTGSVANATFNMEGGYVKVIYDTSNNGSTIRGDLTLNLTGGTITEMRDYNGKNGITIGGNITVNVSSRFNCGTGKFGVWSSGVVSVGGTKTLNLINYQGGDMNSLDIYDYVNVFGDRIPAGFANSGTAGSLNIYDYNGIMGLSLSSFETITLTGSGSEITFLGKVPTSADKPTNLVANDGTAMYIRASANPDVERADYAITENGTGRVLLDDPDYTGFDPILKIDFDNNAGAVTGGTYGTSYNGTNALILTNKYNAADAQYLTISAADLNGLDISKDSFSIVMWYYGVYAGMHRWVGSNDATTAGAGIDMAGNTKFGGMLLSNRDETNTANTGFSVAMLPQNQYMTVGVSGQDGTYNTDGIREASDAAWHQVAFTVDRSGFMNIYVDGVKATSLHIAEEAGVALGSNSLTIGADTLGHYGIGLSYFDDIAIYSGILSHKDIMAQYAVQNLQGLTYEISQRVESVGAEYTDEMKSAITAANESAIALLNTLTFADYTTALSATRALKATYDAFLLAPEQDADVVAVLLSDIHITTNGDTSTKALETVMKDVTSNNLRIDTFINSGDLANDSSAGAISECFEAYAELFAKYSLNWQMIASVGNHDTQYTSANACYDSSMPIYWENMKDYIGALDANGNLNNDGKLYGKGKLVSVYADSYSYLMEMDGFYYLVLNTENPGQTGDASKYTNPDGSYSIEGNQYDPIRHGMWFSEGYLTWIEEMMELSGESGNPIFVVGHAPFIDTCPLSTYSPISINDNSVGSQDAEVRAILCKYKNVFYFSGHLHNSVSMGATWEVSDGNGSFTEINLPAIKNSVRGYADIPVNWIMYVYNEEVVLRCRNYLTGEWLTQFDAVVPLICTHAKLTKTEAMAVTCTADGNVEYYTCDRCAATFADDKAQTPVENVVIKSNGHQLNKVERIEATAEKDGNIEHYLCGICGKRYDSENNELAPADIIIAATGKPAEPAPEPTIPEPTEPETGEGEESTESTEPEPTNPEPGKEESTEPTDPEPTDPENGEGEESTEVTEPEPIEPETGKEEESIEVTEPEDVIEKTVNGTVLIIMALLMLFVCVGFVIVVRYKKC